MNKDLHGYLEHLEKDLPDEIIRIKKEVSPEYEIPAILNKLEARKRSPVLLFENVLNLKGEPSGMPVAINLFGTRERIAESIGTTKDRLAEDYMKAEVAIPPVIVSAAEATVKEVIRTGADVDLRDYPILTHHDMDLGPYFAGGSVWMKDLETGMTNCSIVRIFVDGANRLLVNFNVARHAHNMFQKYIKAGKDMPMVIVLGHHPAFFLGAQTKLLTEEPEIIGGVMGEPLELVPSETWGAEMMVPAHAEMVVEAVLSVTKKDIEAPFGEFTQYYGGQKLNPVAEVTAVTHRKNAIFMDIMPGYADHLLIDIPSLEAFALKRIRETVPNVTAIHVPMSGTARLHAYIQLDKKNDAQPNTAICAAFSADFRFKHVIVVDTDIDVFDEEQVLWAVATRSQWDKDLFVVPRMVGSWLDPTADDMITAKAGIDATKPAGIKDFPEKISLPAEVVQRIRLEDYID